MIYHDRDAGICETLRCILPGMCPSQNETGYEEIQAFIREATSLDAQAWSVVYRAPQQALSLLQQALRLARTSGDTRSLSTVLRHLAYTHYSLGNFEAAHAEATEAVTTARQVGEAFLIGAAVNILGVALRYRGELAEALEAQREHLRLADHIGHAEMRAHALNNIGSVHHDLGEYQQASEYHRSAIELARDLGVEVVSLKALNNLASDLHHLGCWEEAKNAQVEALGIAQRLEVRGEEALALNGLANLALHSASFVEAQEFAGRARIVAQAVGDFGMMAEAQLHSGLASLGLGRSNLAEQQLQSALELAINAHIHSTQASALHALAKTHEQQGSFATALQYLRRAHALDLQIHAESTTRRTKALSALIEAEHYRREVDRERARSAQLTAANVALTEARKTQEELTLKLAHQATHDALTGLAGRALLLDRLEQAITSATALNASLALLFIDLNGFKLVNDTHGHATGDRLLQEVAERLSRAVFGRDSVARLGGDEFVVLATHIHHASRARDVALKILATLVQPYDLGSSTVSIGAAIGVSVFPHDGIDAGALLRHADEAMYVAKRCASSTVQLYERGMNATPASEI